MYQFIIHFADGGSSRRSARTYREAVALARRDHPYEDGGSTAVCLVEVYVNSTWYPYSFARRQGWITEGN